MEKGWKQVFLAHESYRAELARELLENNGINAVVMNQRDSSFPDVGNSEVFVKDQDEQKAIETLKELKH